MFFIFVADFVLTIEDSLFVCLLFLELKLNAKYCYYKIILIHKIYKEKLKKKKWTCRGEKLIKAVEENKLIVMIRRLLWEFNLYWKFTCADEENGKNKKNLPLPSPHPLPSYSFLTCLKTAKPMPLKFSNFLFVSINCFLKNQA